MEANKADPTLIHTTKLAELIFGEDAVNKVKGIKGDKFDARHIWEISTAITQCNNVIGKVTDKHKCWICGLDININESEEYKGFNPECEHILPIAQAVFFLSLYKAKSSSKDNKIYKLEYAWAHHICNQEKHNASAITSGKAGESVSINYKVIDSVLKKIYNSTRKNSADFIKTLKKTYPTFEKFKHARVPEMVKKYEPIVTYINGANNDKYRLFILAGVINTLDTENIRESLQPILNPGSLKYQEAAAKELLDNLTEDIYRDIRKEIDIDTDDKLIVLSKSLMVYNRTLEKFKEAMNRIKFFRGISDRVSHESIQEIFGYNVSTDEGQTQWIESIIETRMPFIMNTYSHVFHRISINAHTRKLSYNPNNIHKQTIEILVDFLILNICKYIIYICNDITGDIRAFMKNLHKIISTIEETYDPKGVVMYLKEKYSEMIDKDVEEGFLHFIQKTKEDAVLNENAARSLLAMTRKRSRNRNENTDELFIHFLKKSYNTNASRNRPSATRPSKRRQLSKNGGSYKKTRRNCH